MNRPYFSIVISVYNRPEQVSRCIQSCLVQTFTNYEIIVVDDGSTDSTTQVIRERFTANNIRLICHENNQGMSSARDTGMKHAHGKWIIRIDSDHALMPHALATLYPVTQKVEHDVGVVGARYQWDTGWISPTFLPDSIVDYVGFISWWAAEGGTDYVHCERLELHQTVQWARRRGSTNILFQLDWARQWKALFIDQVLGFEYTDAVNSYTRSKRPAKAENRLLNAPDQLLTLQETFERHGSALRQYAPNMYTSLLSKATFNAFLVAKRRDGFSYALELLSRQPISLTNWAMFVFGLMGPKALLWAYKRK